VTAPRGKRRSRARPPANADASRAGRAGLAGLLDMGEGEQAQDRLVILSGTGQNVAGLAVFVIATFVMNVIIAHAFGERSVAFGQVTLVTQLAFVAGAATRFGMDMAAVRRVAVEAGRGEPGRSRAVVRIAAEIALAVSVVVAIAAFLSAGPLADFVHVPSRSMRAASIALIFVAVAQVYLGGSRGLKIMRHTLYAYWIGQSVGWIVLTIIGWAVIGKTVPVTVLAYAASWAVATVVAFVSWRSATAGFPVLHAEPHEARELIRYGAPRAPAALLSQALFYTDLFVLSHYLPDDPRISVYAAAIRVAQALVLFLTAVSYMFSPFVADLHERGLRDRLNLLFKQVTRWTLAGTIPLLLLFAIAPGPVLRVFGGDYTAGSAWLRVLLIGQIVNVSVGAAGFVLIMAGRTGWDLFVYGTSFLLDLVLAVILIRFAHLGPMGAAIAQASALVFSNALRLALVWRFVRIQPYDANYARLALPAAIGAVAMIAVHSALSGPKWGLDLLGTAVAGGLVYYTAFLLFGLTPAEKGVIMRVLSREPRR
jgi:O-antigen/teichoic acid export membrane protein